MLAFVYRQHATVCSFREFSSSSSLLARPLSFFSSAVRGPHEALRLLCSGDTPRYHGHLSISILPPCLLNIPAAVAFPFISLIMAPNNWLNVIMPCLRPRSKDGSIARSRKGTDSVDSSADIDWKASLVDAPNHIYEDGLEAVARSRPQTLLVPELPCPTPEQPIFDFSYAQRPIVNRSKSDGIPHSRRNNKNLKGKRKRSQTFHISGPTEVLQGPSEDPKLSSPLTYPSPSRLRPEKLTMDRREPSMEHERPRTAPSDPRPPRKDSFPLRSNSIMQVQGRSHTWRLAPLPPMPALDIGNRSRDRSESSGSIKRKPVPLRIRGSSTPAAPDAQRLRQSSTSDLGPIGFAIEMPGSLPQTSDQHSPFAQRSPFELAALLSPAPAEKGPDTPRLESDARKASVCTAMSSAPTSPTSPIYAHRLSEGARDLLNFFPTTPKLSRANSIRTIHRPASTPPLSPRLVEYAESRWAGVNTSSISPRVGSTAALSPGPISPRTTVVAGQVMGSPDVRVGKGGFSYAEKSLPATPVSAGYARDRFMSIAVGMEMEMDMDMGDMSSLVGLGISPGLPQQRAMSGESIQVFMATTAERIQLKA